MKTKDNFFQKTYACFKKCKKPNTKPDYKSESGSMYWYTDRGVYRLSCHWDGVSTCFWEIDAEYSEYIHIINETRPYDRAVCGFCKWDEFYEIKTLKNPEVSEKDYSWLNDEPIEDYELNEHYMFIEFGTCFVSKMVAKNEGYQPTIEAHPNHFQTDFIQVVI